MTLLSIDFGDRRTGIAVGDRQTGVVTPLEVIELPVGPALVAALRERIREYRAEALVVGLPRLGDGRETDRSRKTREFVRGLLLSATLPVFFQDEFASSDAADEQMSRSGLTHRQKKRRRDALAAAVILRDFLASGRESPDLLPGT